jgi:hypothetical protein
MRVVVDASGTMASLGEVAVWSFDLDAWGESSQAATLTEALTRFARRAGVASDSLTTGERISGPDGIFVEDSLPASDAQIARTLQILGVQWRTLAATSTSLTVRRTSQRTN